MVFHDMSALTETPKRDDTSTRARRAISSDRCDTTTQRDDRAGSFEGSMIRSSTDKQYPFADARSAKFVSKRIDIQSDKLSQREIAFAAGWPSPTILSMIKRGEVKLPLDKTPALARALDVDPIYLLEMVLQDHHPELFEVLRGTLKLLPTKAEAEIIEFLRHRTEGNVPPLSDELKEKLRGVFA
jgi:transcriptional regulator with XRE-family HTH domain